jgi:hypothetical protein
MGISVAVLNEHRQFITNWLRKAIDDRVLEEEPPGRGVEETPGGPLSVMVEQKVLPWMPPPGFLDKGLTSSALARVEKMARSLNKGPAPRVPAPMGERVRPLDRGLTSSTLVHVEEKPRPPLSGRAMERTVEQTYRPQSARSNRIPDSHMLYTRVGSFLSKLSLFDIQLRRDKERARNEEIEKQLERERLIQRNEIKLLLLGTSPIHSPSSSTNSNPSLDDNEPGNSTLLKQLRLQYTGGYTTDEQESFRSIIFSNILRSMKVILKEVEQIGISLDGTDLEPCLRAIQLLQPCGSCREKPSPAAISAIRKLWGDPKLQQALRRSEEYRHNRAAR